MSPILRIVQQQGIAIGIALFFSFILRLLILVIPIIFGKVLDRLAEGQSDIMSLLLLSAAISILYACMAPFLVQKITQTFQEILRQFSIAMVRVIFQKDYQFFEQKGLGSLIRQLERGTLAYEKLFLFIANILLPNSIGLVLIAVYLAYTANLSLVLFLMVWSILSVCCISYAIKCRRPHIQAINDTEDQLSDDFAETFLAARSIKSLNSLDKSAQQLNRSYRDYAQKSSILSFYSESLKSTQFILLNLASCMIMLLGVYIFLQQQRISIGDFVVIYSLAAIFMGNIISLTEAYKEYDQFKLDKAQLDHILALDNIRMQANTPYDVQTPPILTIQAFQYEIHPYKTLTNPSSFQIEAGMKVVIVGATGEGKTTLMKILAGIIDLPQTVYVDATDLHDFSAQQLAQCRSVSAQFPDFLSGDFQRSILLDYLHAEPESCREHLQTLGFAETTIQRLLTETVAIEQLSGGEKKRLDILRTAYMHSPIIYFDEPTASLDGEVATQVWQFIFAVHRAKTMICISHDASYLQHFDLIIKIQDSQLQVYRNTEQLESLSATAI
ncbi:ATP-binding cassette domain-containing protein [Acinetobacter larvae]|uniref:ABC transporter ATP-binding protein n=1 Tax=Acinetobacter larvae TaxID=1789224 RepID=A0A1B2LWX4_9GAMM|nr:ABC transporter ATP-binding protein [Acinetobacter larvae]AOA57389.1 hypothetical protein BFG52_02775 [Acinetobacter larvae]